MMISNWPHLYADGLADVDDVAEEIASRDGAYYEHNKKVSVVGNRWKAVPLCSVPSTWAYRDDWFKEAGAAKFPETWDEWRKVGIALKKKNQPMGQAFGHSLGDPNNWAYSVTWGFGGAEIDESGKVAINSKGTLEAVKFTVGVWKDCLDEGGWPGTTAATTAPTWPGPSRAPSTAPASTSWPSGSSPTSPRSPTTATCPRGRPGASTPSAVRAAPS
jgi:multiple sugar transport system substrate-binding protein